MKSELRERIKRDLLLREIFSISLNAMSPLRRSEEVFLLLFFLCIKKENQVFFFSLLSLDKLYLMQNEDKVSTTSLYNFI